MNHQQENTTIGRLGFFISQLKAEDIPSSALEMAGRCVLDLVASALAGYETQAAKAVRRFSIGFFPDGPSTIWFSRHKISPAGAAMTNAVAASALDLDDGHREAGGHPGASIIPTCLAWAEDLGANGFKFLSAVVIGYEVAVRVSAARDLQALDTFSTGRWCGYGAAAAAGWLKGADPQILAHGMAIAGIHAPIQSASAYSRFGHHTKEGIPWGTLSGTAALEMAEQGFTGPLDILDHPDYFQSAKILNGLGDRWAIEQTYFKPYSCCRWLHAAIDGLLGLMTDHDLKAADVTAVRIHTFRRALGLKNEVNPLSLESAQFSTSYCLAVAAVDGPQALLPLNNTCLGRTDLVEWAGRVELLLDQTIETRFPTQAAARTVIKTNKGRFERLIEHPWGDPANPFDRIDLERKLRTLARGRLSEIDVQKILNGLATIQEGNLSELFRVLGELRL